MARNVPDSANKSAFAQLMELDLANIISSSLGALIVGGLVSIVSRLSKIERQVTRIETKLGID